MLSFNHSPPDPCRNALPGFTYGMPEYGCRAYWKCIDGFSVGHCCSEDSAYVEGMGCLEDIPCFQSCPPEGGIAVRRMYIINSSLHFRNVA